MPPYEVIADEARGLVVAIVSGEIEGKGLIETIARARALSMERGWHILYDLRGANPGEVGTGDLFWMPRTVPALKKPRASRVRVALLSPERFRDIAQFWEDTFRNAGLQARAFVDEAVALAWLAESPGQNS